MAPEIDGKVYITEFAGINHAENLPQPGTMATAEVTESNDYDLIARAIEFAVPQARTITAKIAAPTPSPNPFPILASR